MLLKGTDEWYKHVWNSIPNNILGTYNINMLIYFDWSKFLSHIGVVIDHRQFGMMIITAVSALVRYMTISSVT